MNNKQYAVFEKVPAHGSKPNGVILCSYNTKEEAQSAGEKYGYNTDNYYVGEYNWKLDMTQIPESIAKQPLDPDADYSEMGNVALDLVKKVFAELKDNKN
jgi:hypothetical protein